MVKFPSDYSPEELLERWDEFTAPSRFAGNDDTMDLIFISKRKNNKVKLTRRARIAREPFSSVFHGKIRKTEKGSEIAGFFTKSPFDYAIVGVILVLLFYVRGLIIDRGGDLQTVNILLGVGIVCGLALLFSFRHSKRKYADFIFRITNKEIPIFLSRKEIKKRESEN